MHSYNVGRTGTCHMDGGQTEGQFYLKAFDAHQVLKAERGGALVELPFDHRIAEGIAEVNHLLTLAKAPGDPKEWIEVVLPTSAEGRGSASVDRYYAGHSEGVDAVTVLLRRTDVRQFAAEIYHRRLEDRLNAMEDDAFTQQTIQELERMCRALGA